MAPPGAFHQQLTVADGVLVESGGAHAPTVVDIPLPVPRQGPTRAAARRAAKRRRRTFAGNPDTLRRFVPKALVVAFLAGGTTAFVADDKAVRLDVDGTPRTLHTFADDVTELLADEGVSVGPHDVVAPAPAPGSTTATRSSSATAAPSTSRSTVTTAGCGRPPTPWTGPSARSGSAPKGRTSPSPAPPGSPAPASPWTSARNAP
ncbi:hypothetical protein Smic_31100 [Streptomyces microflavus]|uniref:DUF348 domain-containing protein n=1 Tax=Streptomyces microflavus TaxID=1919 RepID=A0A7J0CRK1_STRMI|nr:hypothetical protein Smic_31100 [Streptomyces microflavus]